MNTNVKKDIETISITEICKTLKEIIAILDYPRRIQILEAIPTKTEKTFEELRANTGISTGSLHHHLKEMRCAGFIYKTEDRPARYGRTQFLEYMISLALEEKDMTRNSLADHWQIPGRVAADSTSDSST